MERMIVQHLHTKDSGKKPSPDSIMDGELAINYVANGETLFIKNSEGAIAEFKDDKYYQKQLSEKTDKTLSLTYSELVSLRDNSQLIPGQQYRITDYTCTTAQEGTRSAGHQFDIIVTADSKNKLNENARAIQHIDDTYFANSKLESWELKYCLDNDTERFAWADTVNGKGVIYWMKDEYDNECPYDFKNIQFKRYAVTNVTSTKLTSDALNDLKNTFIKDSNGGLYFATKDSYGNFVPSDADSTSYEINENDSNWYYTFQGIGSADGLTINKMYDLTVETFKLTKECISYLEYNGAGADTEDYCRENKIEQFSQEYFADDIYYKGRQILNNIVFIGGLNYCYQNEDSWEYNTSSIYGNRFGVNCNSNTFGNYCYSNTFGNSFQANTFGNGFQANTFGNYCGGNTFGNNYYNNTFGDSFQANTFGNYCGGNTFGNNCYNNTFGDSFQANTFGNYCGGNTFGNDCNSNTFGNYCSNNTFGYSCYENTFGDSCGSNTFGNYCYSNTFGNDCSNIKLASDASATTKYNYYQHNHFGDGCQYILFKGADTSSPSAQVQNYNFSQGLQGTGNAYLTIDGKRNLTYETYISRGTDRTIKESVIADTATKKYVDTEIDNIPVEKGTGTNSIVQKGNSNGASGDRASAFGWKTQAIGNVSHTEGVSTIALNAFEHAEGRGNLSIKDKTVHTVGIGSLDGRDRKNAEEIHRSGDKYVIGIGGYDGTNSQTEGIKTVQEVVGDVNTELGRCAKLDEENYFTKNIVMQPTNAGEPNSLVFKYEEYTGMRIDAGAITIPYIDGYIIFKGDSSAVPDVPNVLVNYDHGRIQLISETDKKPILRGIASPTEDTDAANKKYVDDTIKANIATQITYTELKALRDAGKLVPGQQYRITDYTCTTTQANTKSAGHVFDIIVTSDDEGTLNEEARAALHTGDEYFSGCNLNAWKIWYCLDNDTDRFAWADSANGKGIIYRMIDEWNNDVPYDFKNIQFKRYAVTNVTSTKLTSDALNYFKSTFVKDSNGGLYFAAKDSYGNFVPSNANGASYEINENDSNWYYTFQGIGSADGLTINKMYDLTVETFKLTDECISDLEGNDSGADTEDYCRENKIEQFNQEYFGDDICYKGRQILNNIVFIGGLNYCYYNAEDFYWEYNTSSIYGNRFDVNCNSNTFGNDCYYNTFGNDCIQNTFGNNCYNNTFGNGCESNTFGNICGSNTFGNNCGSNTFGNYCGNNTFGNYYSRNIFGNNCWNNIFGNDCENNTFGNSCNSNTFGNNCENNTFGNDCQNNTFGNSCIYIKFASDASATTKYNYYQHNHFGDGCQYILFKGVGTSSPSAQVQNYNFAQGLKGTSRAYLTIGGARNLSYETKVAKNSNGELKIYCEADLIL